MKRLRIFGLMIIISLQFLSLSAQNFQSLHKCPGCSPGATYDYLYSGIQHSNSYYYGVGMNYCNSSGIPTPPQYTPVIVKYDGYGQSNSGISNTWIKSYSSFTYSLGQFFDIKEDHNQNLVVAGKVYNNNSLNKFSLLKTNADGLSPIYWDFDDNSQFESQANSVIETKNTSGNFTGFLAVGTQFQSSSRSDIILAKVDPNLNPTSATTICWLKTLNINGALCDGVCVLQNLINTGTPNSYIVLANAGNNLYLAEINETGVIVNQKLINGGTLGPLPNFLNSAINTITLKGKSIVQAANGDYLISGDCICSNTYAITLRISATFNVLWATVTGLPGSLTSGSPYAIGTPSHGRGVLEDASGNIILALQEGNYAVIEKQDASGNTAGSTTGFTANTTNNAGGGSDFQTIPNFLSKTIDDYYLISGYAIDPTNNSSSSGVFPFYMGKTTGTGSSCTGVGLATQDQAQLMSLINYPSINTQDYGPLTTNAVNITTSPGSLSISCYTDNNTCIGCHQCTMPSPTVTGAGGTTCLGDAGQVALSATKKPGADLYWYTRNSSGNLVLISNSKNVNPFTVSADGYYTATQSYPSSPDCESVWATGITVWTPVKPDILGGTCSLANGTTTDLYSSTHPNYYKWYSFSTTPSISSDPYITVGSSASSGPPVIFGPDVYTLSVSYDGTCWVSSVEPVSVSNVTPDFTSSYTCTGSGPQYTFTSTSTTNLPAATESFYRHYYWDFGDGTHVSTGDATVTKTYGTPGTYTVSLTYILPGCSSTVSHNITIHSSEPDITLNPPGYDCNTSSPPTLNVTVNSDGGPDITYSWKNATTNDNTGLDLTKLNQDNEVVTGTGSNDYNYQVTVSNNSCGTPTSASEIVYHYLNSSDIPVFSPSLIYVLNTETSLDISHWTNKVSGVSNYNIRQNPPGYNGSSSPTLNAANIYSANGNGDYLFDYTYTDPNTQCTKNSTTPGTARLIDPPVLTCPNATYDGCIGQTTTLKASASWSSTNWSASVDLYVYWYDNNHPAPPAGTTDFDGSSYPYLSKSLKLSASVSESDYNALITASMGTSLQYTCILVAQRKAYGSWIGDYEIGRCTSTVNVNPLQTLDLTVNGTSMPGGTIQTCKSSLINLPTVHITNSGTYFNGTSTVYYAANDFKLEWTLQIPPSGTNSPVYTENPMNSFDEQLPSDYGHGNYVAKVTNLRTGCEAAVNIVYVDNHPVLDYTTATGAIGYLCASSSGTIELKCTLPSTSTLQNYKWYKKPSGTVLSTNSNYYAPSQGTYYFVATLNNALGCSETSADIVVTDPPALEITSSNPVGCGTSSSVTLTVASPGSNYYGTSYGPAYYWYKDGNLISGASASNSYSLTVSFPSGTGAFGYYQAKSAGCTGLVASNIIKIGYPCTIFNPGTSGCTSCWKAPSCSYTTWNSSYSFPTGGSTPTLVSGPIYIDGTVRIPAGANINCTDCEFYAGSCAKIIIEKGSGGLPGGKLTLMSALTGTSLESCDHWQGIEVDGDGTSGKPSPNHGQLVISGASRLPVVIKDADCGVYSKDGGDIQIDYASFSYNKTHLAIEAYNYDHHANITNSFFGPLNTFTSCSNSYSPGNSNSNGDKPMVYIHGAGGISIGGTSAGNIFQNTQPQIQTSGIEAWNTIKPAGIGIVAAENNFIDNMNTGFYANGTLGGGTGIELYHNNFGDPTGNVNAINGVIFKDVSGCQVGDYGTYGLNNFYYLTNGMQFYSSSSSAATTKLYHNDFEYNQYGLVVAPDIFPITATAGSGTINTGTNSINLAIKCNKFMNNHGYGIVGCGNLIDQGIFTGSPTTNDDAENNFNGIYVDPVSGTVVNATNPSTNTFSDIIWIGYDVINPVKYFYAYPFDYSGIQYSPTAPNNTTSSSININYQSKGGSQNFISTGIEVVAGSSCLGSWKRDPLKIKNGNELNSSITIFPNPSTSHFTVKVLTEEINCDYTLEIWDLTGRRILVQKYDQKLIEIDGSAWTPGTYFLRLYSPKGQVYNAQIVRQ
jgi:hypothetical protein